MSQNCIVSVKQLSRFLSMITSKLEAEEDFWCAREFQEGLAEQIRFHLRSYQHPPYTRGSPVFLISNGSFVAHLERRGSFITLTISIYDIGGLRGLGSHRFSLGLDDVEVSRSESI